MSPSNPEAGSARGKQALRFAASGLAATGLHLGLGWLLVQGLGRSALVANLGAFIGAHLLSYALNARWTFASSFTGASYLRFATVSLLGLLWTAGTVHLASSLGLGTLGATLAVACTLAPASFLAHALWTFARHDRPLSADVPGKGE